MEQEEYVKRASMMPPNNVPEGNAAPARRTVYSKDPRICKHQFGGASTDPFCRYCATTNPNVRMSFNELGA